MGADVRFGPARWGRLAVALVNTAPYERQEDLLTSPGQLRELLLARDEPGPIEVNDRDLADARQARNALAAVFGARENGGQVAALLNDLLARTAQPRLAEHEGVPLHLHVEAPGASWGGWLAASGAMALALLIAEHGTGVLGGCQAHGCAHVLLRTGPGPARRFCDNACASRTRVAAYRANRTASTLQKTSNTGQKQTGALGSRQWRSAGDYPCVRTPTEPCLSAGRSFLDPIAEPPNTPQPAPRPRPVRMQPNSPHGCPGLSTAPTNVCVRPAPATSTAQPARMPSAIRPWTPRHSGPQRDKLTHHGTKENGPLGAC